MRKLYTAAKNKITGNREVTLVKKQASPDRVKVLAKVASSRTRMGVVNPVGCVL